MVLTLHRPIYRFVIEILDKLWYHFSVRFRFKAESFALLIKEKKKKDTSDIFEGLERGHVNHVSEQSHYIKNKGGELVSQMLINMSGFKNRSQHLAKHSTKK